MPNHQQARSILTGTCPAHGGMMLGATLGVALLLVVVYAFWMAGELGVGPRWRRPRPERRRGSGHFAESARWDARA
jgi:hypothetical protein